MDRTPFTGPDFHRRFFDYVNVILPDLMRKDRYPRAEVYMRGLLPEGESKSIEPIATRLPDGTVQGGIPR
jgi:hypothetical protein